jgi:bacillithiol biosynthesis deacetylase BshB1
LVDILVFGPHPDDAEFAMGASLLKFIREGRTATLCVLTRGESGTYGTPKVREEEMKEACRKMGANLEMLQFRDCQIFDNFENRLTLAGVIRKHRPRVIFAPYHTNPGSHLDGTAHPDHTATGTLVRFAARYAKFKGIAELKQKPWAAGHLIYYMLPRCLKPNLVVDISDYMAEWEEAANSHQSQMQLRSGAVLKYLRDVRVKNGMLAGLQYAEGFFIEEPVVFDIDLFM